MIRAIEIPDSETNTSSPALIRSIRFRKKVIAQLGEVDKKPETDKVTI
jgi:hypothetical protein